MTIGFKATLEILCIQNLTQVEDVFKTMRFGEVIRYCFTKTCKYAPLHIVSIYTWKIRLTNYRKFMLTTYL